MRTHIKVIAIVAIILNAIGLVGSVIGLFGGVVGGLFSGSLSGFLGGVLGGILGGLIGGAMSLFGLIAGFGLLKHQQWARYVAIIWAIISLFNFPIGTLIGVYMLWVLLNDETKTIFAVGAP